MFLGLLTTTTPVDTCMLAGRYYTFCAWLAGAQQEVEVDLSIAMASTSAWLAGSTVQLQPQQYNRHCIRDVTVRQTSLVMFSIDIGTQVGSDRA